MLVANNLCFNWLKSEQNLASSESCVSFDSDFSPLKLELAGKDIKQSRILI